MAANPPNVFPALRYEDAPAAIEWLGRAFGFEVHFQVDGPDGTVGHAELRAGAGMIMLGSAKDDELRLVSPKAVDGRVTAAVYVAVEDPAAHYEQARASDAEIVQELRETEYGSTEYSARDLEGNLWSFGTYNPLAQAT